MRVVVVGKGVQGVKRAAVAGSDVVAIVDPARDDVDFARIEDAQLADFDAALLCVPDGVKFDLIAYLVGNGKHVLVEKPLLLNATQFDALEGLQSQTGATIYVAYNHRFEPHIASMEALLRSGSIGTPYSVFLSYGNGTAELVRLSQWRDEGLGVIPDLGSHLLDMVDFWWGLEGRRLDVIDARTFENQAFDYALIRLSGDPVVYLETSMVSWRNRFRAEIQASEGSAHISSLCKWGPTTLTVRDRKHPSGRPDERSETLIEPDPTWAIEYEHFRDLVGRASAGNLSTSRVIARLLIEVQTQLEER